MTKEQIDNFNRISYAIEECISQYVTELRKKIPKFVAGHFSLAETIEIQKRSFLRDVLANPLNSLWSIPYLTLKKIVEAFDKQGFKQLTFFFQKIPASIKTGYQNEIEQLVAKEFLQWRSSSSTQENQLLKLMHQHPDLTETIFINQKICVSYAAEFREVLENYSATRASVADLAGSLLTVFVGWIYFGDKTLGVLGIGDRIAKRMAKDKAASQFFLGDGLGTTFYTIFPPQPTVFQLFVSTLSVGILLTFITLVASAFSDPLRKKLGLQEKKLHSMLDELESNLLVQFKRRLKFHYSTQSANERANNRKRRSV